VFLRVVFDLPHATGADGNPVFTQPWAVSANLRIDRDVDSRSTQQLNVTSQFVSGSVAGVTIEGVRLNTPGSLQQIDQARRLDGPLDYSRYEPIRFWPLFEFPGATFVLDHAFCGYAAATSGHTPGSGKLRIQWFSAPRNATCGSIRVPRFCRYPPAPRSARSAHLLRR
jgi:hypothetical protein